MKCANVSKLHRKSGVRWCERGAPVFPFDGPIRWSGQILELEFAAAFHGSRHGDLVRILYIAPGGDSGCYAGYAHRR